MNQIIGIPSISEGRGDAFRSTSEHILRFDGVRNALPLLNFTK